MTSLIDPSRLLTPTSQWLSSPNALLTALGALTLAKTAYNIISFVTFYLRPSRLNRYLHFSRDSAQPWAMVTGATDGIGKAFAHELASQGFNVVIHGRNPAKLSAVENELRAAHPGRDFRTLKIDAGLVGCASCLGARESGLPAGEGEVVDFEGIVKDLAALHLTVIVSNAGGAPNPVYRTLGQISGKELAANVSLNALFPLHLLSHLLPVLERNAPGLVVTVGSLADNGLPLLSSYGPSKSFLMSMTGCVARDLKVEGKDIEVVGMRCGRVTGVGHEKREASLFFPDARTWARAALGRVGSGRMECTPYWPHALQQAVVVDTMPGWLRERVFAGIMTGLREEERAKLKAGKDQ